MSEHFIKNIEIKNFKCFDNFKAEGFGRVNLIGGKNNVGKTAFMEACYILSSKIREHGAVHIVFNLVSLDTYRGFNMTNTTLDFNDIFEKYDNVLIKNDKEEFSLKIEGNIFDKKVLVNNEDIGLKPDTENGGIKFTASSIDEFIPSYMVGNDLIISLFDKIKKQRKRTELNDILFQYDNNILEFDIIENRPQVFLKNLDKFQDISELGHGLKRYIAIICSILINKDGFLFLDEIENGIHYTHLDKLWEIILTISKEQNVQVFATTHSDECIKALVTANREDVETYQPKEPILKNDEIKFIELGRVDGKVDSIIFDFEELENEVEQNMEIRGW